MGYAQVLVIAADGQLGSLIRERSEKVDGIGFSYTTLNDLDVTNKVALEEVFFSKKWDLVINCSAYTSVDAAEDNLALAYAINRDAVSEIGRLSAEIGARVIHVSTDYVFDGSACRPYSEEDTPNPVSVYGQSKLEGEQLLIEHNPSSIIVRTSWLYSELPNNFYQTMCRLGAERDELSVVFDQVGTPTYGGDLADAILAIVLKVLSDEKLFVPGVYHYSNEGVTSWFDFALSIFEFAGINCRVRPVTSDLFPTKASRPAYSVLNKRLIKETFDLEIPHWRVSLKAMIEKHFTKQDP
jgi:dTDP-4-dehydrorhamnose reductase